MSFPPGWHAEAPSRRGGKIIYKFYPDTVAEASLAIVLREIENSQHVADAFQDTMYSAFHHVNADELFRLRGFLDDLADASQFQLYEASTTYHNDRRVLRILGTRLRSSLRNMSLFVDMTGNGRRVQEIVFNAPPEQFVQLLPSLESIMQSIVWRL